MIKNDNFNISHVDFCYYKKTDSSYSFDMRERPCHGLTLMLSGSLELSFGSGRSFSACAGDIIIQRKGDSYKLISRGHGAEYIVISYLCEPQELCDELIAIGRVRHTGEHYARYAEAFRRAADVGYGICAAPLLRAVVQEILCNLIRDTESVGIPTVTGIAATARSFIDANSDMPITVTDIAMASGSSPSYLRELFRREYGTSPNKYLSRVRIERAKEMLSSRMFTTAEIAAACGFKNVYYFSRVFKEQTGITPGKWRR